MAAFILTTALLVVPGALAGVLGVPPYAFLPSPLPYHFYSQQPAFTESRSFYSPPPESRFQGFYYRTAWLDGSADSHVLFVTGQQSRQLVQEAAHLTRTINTTAVNRAESSVVYPASTIPLLGGAIPLDAFIPPWARGFVAGSAEETPTTTTTETATTSDSSSNNVGEESSRSEVIVPAVESNSVVETSSEAILTEPSSSTVEDEVTSSSAAPEPTSSTVEDEVTSSSAAPEPTSSTVSEEPASSSTQGEPSSSSATVEEVAASTTEGSEETTTENTTGSDTTSSEE